MSPPRIRLAERAEASAALRVLAVQDWIVGVYLALLCLAAFFGRGPTRDVSLARMSLLFLFFVGSIALVRGSQFGRTVSGALLYRVAVYGAVQISYFWLRDLLRASVRVTYDSSLYALDLRVFGFEPAVWADRYVGPHVTGWFAFFYFSYFVVLAVHVWPILFFSRDAKLIAEFGLVTLTVYCTAQVMYLVVPGVGPHQHLAHTFVHDLPEGFWLRAVRAAVNNGGAEFDVFPSLHTAGPTAIALFSFRHRARSPFRWSWPVTAFFALNIIGATLFLRWHWLIDIVAGIGLAVFGVLFAAWVSPRETVSRASLGLGPAWPAYDRDRRV